MLAVFHLFPVPELGAPKKSAMSQPYSHATSPHMQLAVRCVVRSKKLQCTRTQIRAIFGYSPKLIPLTLLAQSSSCPHNRT